ncbi:hypothetical protein [Kribbella lupini]|uniref:hypothetical protein n=1 Tax=Kribbella lupini TaxID=291602 RepID=UPI0031DC1E46
MLKGDTGGPDFRVDRGSHRRQRRRRPLRPGQAKVRQGTGSPQGLEAAEKSPADPETIRVLAERLDLTRSADVAFADELMAEWEKAAPESRVVNQISGPVTGKVLQAGEVHGNITF